MGSIHSLLAIFTRPIIGRIIDQIGEERSLLINYGVLTFVFIGYSFVKQAWIIYVLYVLDYALSGLDDLDISSYAARITDESELLPTLAMGNTLSHVMAILFPLTGSLVWDVTRRVPIFTLSVAISLFAMVYSLYVYKARNKVSVQ